MSQTKKLVNKCTKLKPSEIDKFLGKSYTLDRSENYDEFLLELGVKKHVRLKALTSKPTVVLSQENNQYVLSTSYPEGRHIKVKFRPGKNMNRWGQCERQTSSVFRTEDNKLIEEQNTDDKKILIEREFKKKELIVTMEVNNVKCTRWFILTDASKISINTETSRRSSLWEVPEAPSTHSQEERIQVSPEESSIEEEDEKVCY